MSSFGLYNVELRWFIDYFFLRKQIVQFNGMLSEPNSACNGFPQGSILGPLLFLFFANDVLSPLRHCKIITYTDETVILHPQAISMRDKATFLRAWIISITTFVIMNLSLI